MENSLNDDEFIFYQKGGNILSIGMKFDNIFRKHNLPAMIGGNNKGKSTASLGLPIGLNFIKQNNEDLGLDFKPNVMKGGVIKNEIYDKLLHLAENRSFSKQQTRKLKRKRKNKTRKFK
tara:strand:- start:89 stop:445 length:357 start_codon:yes stop_codon:yes gene_type:complete